MRQWTPPGDHPRVARAGRYGSGSFGFDDDGLAVADHDPLAGDGLELGGEVARPALLVDTSVVVLGAQVTEPGVRTWPTTPGGHGRGSGPCRRRPRRSVLGRRWRRPPR